MTWIDDNKRPLMAVGAILGVAWFGGRYFDKNQSFNAEESSDAIETFRQIMMDVSSNSKESYDDYKNAPKDELANHLLEMWCEDQDDLDRPTLGSSYNSYLEMMYALRKSKKAETFDAERIQYNYVVHREPKGSSKGGWFKSKKAETFEYTEEWYNSALPRIVKRVKEELVNDERIKLDDPKMYAFFEDEMFDGEPTSLDSYVYSALELEYPTLTEKQKIEISEDADMLSDVWFGIDMTDEEFRDWLNEEYDDEGNLISRAETFEAKGYNGISASKIKVLEKYIENGGQALDYHELPYHTQRQLEMGRVHELLYQDVNRWLQDNAHNPHHAMPSWLSAETFEAKGDCAECYGTGGLYDSHMGINDECHSCGGTGFDY